MVSKRHSQQRPQPQPQQQQKTMNPYQAFYQQTPTNPVVGAREQHNDDNDIAVGVAMDTRNYQELLKAAAAPPPTAVTVRGNKLSSQPPPPYQSPPPPPYPGHKNSDENDVRQSASSVRFPVLLGNSISSNSHHQNANNNNNNNDDEEPAILGEAVTESDDEVDHAATAATVIDATVRGLPVETRNYEAFGRYSTPQAGASSAAAAPVSAPGDSSSNSKPRFPIQCIDINGDADDDDPNESGDTVYGLPISTSNYEAIVGAGARVKTKKTRSRGYSDQGHSGGSVAERRASAPVFTNARSPAQYATAPQAMTASMVPRGSCFETRRATSVAVVPFSGWLFVQSATLRRWKKQLAVLSGVEFKYSKGPGHAPTGFGTLQAVQPWHGMPHGLELTLTSGKRVPVHCANASEYEQWLLAFQRALDKLQHLSGHSKTSYTVTASEQHEGYLFKQDARPATTWRRHHFVARADGFIECRVDADASNLDARNSGYIKAVSFADVHPNGIAIELDTGVSMLVYAESYDERMLWYAALSSAALAHGQAPQASVPSVKASYVQTARANHAGWLHKQAGLFKSWKRFYFTLHGAEVSFSKDANAAVVLCDKVQSVDDWSGKQNGLEIRLKSGRVWRVCADSYDSAKRWRTLLRSATARQGGDSFNVKKYVASRRRKGLTPVYGGWLTGVNSGVRVRQFYVVDAGVLGDASEVDHQLRPISRVVDVGASRDLDCGLVITFLNGSKLKLAADSVDSCKTWYEILKASL